MKLLKVLGCIVLLVMLGCGGTGGESSTLGSVFPVIDSPPTSDVIVPGGSGNITGRVSDGSGYPMYGVSVSLFSGTDSLLALQSTDAYGNYTFTGFASGTYKVSFTKPGYADVWYSGVTSKAAATLVTVTSPNTTGSIDGVMGVGGKITGRVTDESLIPMSGVSVSLYSETDSLLTLQTTDANGDYTFTGFASGSYKVSFTKPGYADVWYSGATSKAAATLVTVTSPNTTGSIDGVMGVGGKINGRVTDSSSGSPMSGVSVSLYSDTDSLLTLLSTDANGDYTFTGFASGSYKISFTKTDYADVWYSGATSKTAATLVAVISPDTTSRIDAVMSTVGKITGRVTDTPGNPISGITVSLYSDTDSLLTLQTTTDANGDYTLSGLVTGTYKVSFTKTGYADVWYSSATTQATATSVTVTAPYTTSSISGVM